MIESKYCRALVELRSRPAHELKEVGDQWRTPDLLFWGVNAMFGPLMLDLFADDSNAKCPVWYTAEDNALTQDWSEMLSSIGGRSLWKPALQPLSVPRKASYHWHDAHHELCSCSTREGRSICLPGKVSHKRNVVAGRCGSRLLYSWANWFRSARVV